MSGNLTIGELEAAIATGEIDTVIVAFADAQGRLVGKRVSARFFHEEVLPPRRRGVQLPPVGGCRHEHRRRLRDVELGEGLRRHDAAARRRDPPPHPLAARERAGDGGPRVGERRSGRPVAARHPEPPARPPRRPGARSPTPAPSSSSSSSTTRIGMPGPAATGISRRRPTTTSTTTCSRRDGSSRCCATSGSRWMARGCTARASRASATSASRRSPSATRRCSRPPTSTRSTRTARRRSPATTARR